MGSKKQYQIFIKSLAGVITILLLGSGLLIRGSKDKSEFKQETGIVKYLEKEYQEFPNRHHGKYRYLIIDSYPKAFEIFVGKDPGDFSPEFENIDALQPGDAITVFYDETSTEPDPRINRLLQYIDKQDEAYFIKGALAIKGGYFLIACGILLGMWILYLKLRGIII